MNIIDNTNEINNWEKIKNHFKNNLTIWKGIIIVITLGYIVYILILDKQSIRRLSQSGGGISPITSGFNMVFSLVNSLFMIFGIVLILILIPTLPIIFFLIACYYLCRRQLWDIRTM